MSETSALVPEQKAGGWTPKEGERFIPDGMNAFQRNTKRVADCLMALVALVVFSPLFLVCYVAVRREDGGPAIFRQERIGRFGRPFYIYPQIRDFPHEVLQTEEKCAFD